MILGGSGRDCLVQIMAGEGHFLGSSCVGLSPGELRLRFVRSRRRDLRTDEDPSELDKSNVVFSLEGGGPGVPGGVARTGSGELWEIVERRDGEPAGFLASGEMSRWKPLVGSLTCFVGGGAPRDRGRGNSGLGLAAPGCEIVEGGGSSLD